jgi:nicotinamide-nucleotide amidase
MSKFIVKEIKGKLFMNESLNLSMIVIGDEILNGRTTDLNGSWLAKYLFQKGLSLKAIRFVRDNKSEINAALSASIKESDIILTSGGIGPTLDDKTKNTLADYFNQKIIERDDVAQIVTQNYLQFGRIWQSSLNHYHFFPEHFVATNNPKGLAPGITYWDKSNQKLILAAPGVPKEFSAMVDLEFLPLIKKHFGHRIKDNFQTVIRTNGIPEEKIFFELCPTLWSDLEKYGKVSSLPHVIGIDIVISYSASEAEHIKRESDIHKLIKEGPLSNYVWQYGNLPISDLVFKKALDLKCTFSFAESCTGGLASSKITDMAGSSEIFLGAVVSYSNEAKMDLLNVKAETLKEYGAVSEQVATEMAFGAREKLKTDFAISLTGIAGPTGATPQKPLGLVFIGYASKTKSGAKSFQFPGDRSKRKDRFSDMALLILLNLMENKL